MRVFASVSCRPAAPPAGLKVSHGNSTRTAPGGRFRPREFRVTFSRPLRDARLIAVGTQPIPPSPATTPAPTPVAPAATFTPAPQPPAEFVPNDTSKEILADRERIEDVLGNVRAAVQSLRAEQAARIQELRRVAVELATTIASRLLHERIESGDLPIEAKVRDMIDQLGDDEPVVIRLNPADLELLNDRLGDIPLTADRANPRFVADSNLGRGDCHVDGRESMLVSDVARELEEIRDELLRSLKNARN